MLAVITRLQRQEVKTVECGGRKVISVSLLNGRGDSIFVVGVHSPHPVWGMDHTIGSIECALSLTTQRAEGLSIVAGDLNVNFDPEDSSNSLYNQILEDFGDGTVAIGETYYAHTRIDHVFHYPKNTEVVKSGSGILDLPVRFARVPGIRDHRPIVVTYALDRE